MNRMRPSPPGDCFSSAQGRTAESAWNEKQIEIVGESMPATDPLAEIRLSFDCPSCGAHFEESLDLPSFIWEELRRVETVADAGCTR